MKYSFQCPAPCNYEIKVDTQADDSSVAKKTTRLQRKHYKIIVGSTTDMREYFLYHYENRGSTK